MSSFGEAPVLPPDKRLECMLRWAAEFGDVVVVLRHFAAALLAQLCPLVAGCACTNFLLTATRLLILLLPFCRSWTMPRSSWPAAGKQLAKQPTC